MLSLQCQSEHSLVLQGKMRALILTLIVPLDISKEEQQRLDDWISGLIAEPGPNGSITPRHAREKNNLLALQLCHAFPLYLTEEESTIRNSHNQGLVFLAGNTANTADGTSLSMLSNDHVRLGLSFEQVVHLVINHLRGLEEIQSLSSTAIESAEGRRQRVRQHRIDVGELAAQDILRVAQNKLSGKTLVERSVQALEWDVLVLYLCL
jgi:hypothetical protein